MCERGLGDVRHVGIDASEAQVQPFLVPDQVNGRVPDRWSVLRRYNCSIFAAFCQAGSSSMPSLNFGGNLQRSPSAPTPRQTHKTPKHTTSPVITFRIFMILCSSSYDKSHQHVHCTRVVAYACWRLSPTLRKGYCLIIFLCCDLADDSDNCFIPAIVSSQHPGSPA